MIILNGASWERFAAFYNFKDYNSMAVNSVFGGAAFALTIMGVRMLSMDAPMIHHHYQYHAKRAVSHNVTHSELDDTDIMMRLTTDSSATTSDNSIHPPAMTSLAREAPARRRMRFVDVMRSPWVLYAVAANCVPFMVFIPDVNKYTISPSICVWTEVIPGPIAFFVAFAFGTQSYTVLWVTQLESAIPTTTSMSTANLIAAYALQFIGIVTAFSSAMVLAVPRCIFEGHQAAVNTSVLCNFVIIALLECKERTREGLVCLGVMLAAVYGLIKLDDCKCSLYGIVEVAGSTAQICYLAYRVARLKRFNGAEYAVHVTAIACISWLIMQFTLNFCVNRNVHFQIRGSSRDGMPDRSAMSRITYNPTFFGKHSLCFLPGSSFSCNG